MYGELAAQLEYEASTQEIAGRTADYDEGVRAFMEKRDAGVQGGIASTDRRASRENRPWSTRTGSA